MQPTPPCRVTLLRPNRLSTAGQVFERDVETEVPLRLFHKLYRERQRQFAFAPEGIALMMRTPPDELLSDPTEGKPAHASDDTVPEAEEPEPSAAPRADTARSGVKMIRKPRSGEKAAPDPEDTDEAGVDI